MTGAVAEAQRLTASRSCHSTGQACPQFSRRMLTWAAIHLKEVELLVLMKLDVPTPV